MLYSCRESRVVLGRRKRDKLSIQFESRLQNRLRLKSVGTYQSRTPLRHVSPIASSQSSKQLLIFFLLYIYGSMYLGLGPCMSFGRVRLAIKTKKSTASGPFLKWRLKS